MVKQALILAAGRGNPVGDPGTPNCLALLGGRPLIERTLATLQAAGIERVALSVGWQGALVRRRVLAMLSNASAPAGQNEGGARFFKEVHFVDNPHWEKPNGLSVQVARRWLSEPTLLVMADQVTAPELVATFARARVAPGRTLLGVDSELSRVFDIDDATKVKLGPGDRRVVDIGKHLTDYQAVSTSLFVASPTLVDALDVLHEPSLTQGVAESARRGQVDALDVTGSVWQDVDSKEMRLHAEWLLRAYGDQLAEPAVKGEVSSAASGTLALIERLLVNKDAPHYTLFNPGPVMTSTRVKAAMVHHDVCHRDEDYTGVVRRLQEKLRPVFGAPADHDILLLTGSGTAAMEAALGTVVPRGRGLLVISNGVFGERLAEIASAHGLPLLHHRLPWGQTVDPQAVAAELDKGLDVGAIAMIRHETSVGLLNPVGAIGELCRARGLLSIVDAVSALGADDLDVGRDALDVCFASSNKCLHAVAGVSFVCVAPRVWQSLVKTPVRSYYLDLRRYKRALELAGQTPFTPAVSTLFALETALDELAEQGGPLARREIYRLRNLRIRRVFTSLGFESFTNTGRESVAISTLRVPEGLTGPELYEKMKARGFVLYKAKGALEPDHIQVANMGELSDASIDALLAAVAEVVEAARLAHDGSPRPRLLRSV